MIHSSNPTLRVKSFQNLSYTDDSKMTLEGTVNKVIINLSILILSALLVWFASTIYGIESPIIPVFIIVGFAGGLILAIVTVFKKEWSGVTSPLYAILEGLALGGISIFFEKAFPGIVIQAISITFAVMFSLLFAYKSGRIKATENFKLGVTAATGGIFMIYIVTIILNIFGINMPFIHDNGWIGIGFSLFVVIIASLNLVMDFDFIEKGAEEGAPKYMEWYGAFSLMVTLIWLYLEILRLLTKIRSR